MEKIIENFLKQFQKIEPRSSYLERSKGLILASTQEAMHEEVLKTHFWSGMRLGIAISLSSLVLVALVGGFSYYQNKTVASLNDKALAAEAVAAARQFNLQISDAGYYTESAARVSMALDEISGCKELGGCITPTP
ncbi:MAG: hypothetical protein Q7R62_01340 [bacterium]|nr:hypothetical protein [bacterium]